MNYDTFFYPVCCPMAVCDSAADIPARSSGRKRVRWRYRDTYPQAVSTCLVRSDLVLAFSNPRMILKRVWVGKGAGVGSDLLSRGQGRGGCEGAGGRSSGACSRSAATFLSMGLLSPRAAVSLRAQPGRREPGGRAKVPAARCPPTTASGSRPAVLSCAAASAAHTRCRSSGRLAAPEKQP